MEVEYAYTCSSSADADNAGHNYRGDWHRRLRLRKSSASSLTVKSKTEEEKIVTEPQKKPSQDEHQNQQVINSSSSKLTFTCTDCKDNSVFSPQGLLKHFNVFHGGKGEPPTFPCDMCNFAAPEFNILQQHRMKHRKCRLMCEICNDNVLQTLSQLKKHCKTQHSLNGQYHCGKCRFSTKELKVFVHHSCPAATESLIESNEMSGIKPMNGELNRIPLAAGDVAVQKEELLRPMSTGCNRGWRKKKWWKKKESTPKHHNTNISDLKVLLPKPESQWASSGFLPFSAAGLLDENGVLLNPTRTLEETQQFLERTVNNGKKWPVTLKGEPQLTSQSCTGSLPLQQKIKQYSIPLPRFRNSGQNKLSSLMEKNNISVPPDCTTKVVGIKMVDGKKHLVLKVIPKAKLEVSPELGKVSSVSYPVEFKSTESGSQNERKNDPSCPGLGNMTTNNSAFSFSDATSSSGHPEKLCEKQHEDPTEDMPHVDNTENDCNDPSSALTEIPGASPQTDVSGTEKDVNVANQRNAEKQLTFPDVISDSNIKQQLNALAADISLEGSSNREVGTQSLHVNVQEARHTKTHKASQEKASEDSIGNCLELTCQNDSGCNGDLASSIPSDLGCLEEEFKSQLSTLLEEERISKVILNGMDKKKDPLIMQSSLLHLNEQVKMSCSPTKVEKEAIFELDSLNPTFVSLHKHATEPLFNSPSENGALLFQDSCDEDTNNVDPGDPPLPLEQSCTSETVEEPNSLVIIPDSCHNPDLNPTLDELPVRTISHLPDDPEVTFRGITKQSGEPGGLCIQKVGLQSPKAIEEATAASIEKDSTQSNVCLPPAIQSAMKRKRQGEPAPKKSQEPISKLKKQLLQSSSEKDPPASIPYWEPIPPAMERTLRLLPVCSSQPIKVPRLNQPVIVLNHPDTDIPEVANIMRVVHKHKGAVQKVVLSQATLKALSVLNCDTFRNSPGANCHSSHYRKVWPQGTVKERFILKLKLKRLIGHKYKVAPPASKLNRYQSTFRCWFCGRLFRNQEVWVGHGQRHLMEATRDWNKLFNSEEQYNDPI